MKKQSKIVGNWSEIMEKPEEYNSKKKEHGSIWSEVSRNRAKRGCYHTKFGKVVQFTTNEYIY
jgi:hypothetical protein